MKQLFKILSLLLAAITILSSCTKEFTGYQLCGVIEDYPPGKGKVVRLCYLPDSGLFRHSTESFGWSPIGSNGNFNIVSPAAPSADKLMTLNVLFGNGINTSNPSASGASAILRIFENESSSSAIGATTYENCIYGIGIIGPGSCGSRHIYVDRDVKITGTGTITDYLNKSTMICDLDFKAGWNDYYLLVDSIAHYKALMTEPDGMKWIFWDNDF